MAELIALLSIPVAFLLIRYFSRPPKLKIPEDAPPIRGAYTVDVQLPPDPSARPVRIPSVKVKRRVEEEESVPIIVLSEPDVVRLAEMVDRPVDTIEPEPLPAPEPSSHASHYDPSPDAGSSSWDSGGSHDSGGGWDGGGGDFGGGGSSGDF